MQPNPSCAVRSFVSPILYALLTPLFAKFFHPLLCFDHRCDNMGKNFVRQPSSSSHKTAARTKFFAHIVSPRRCAQI